MTLGPIYLFGHQCYCSIIMHFCMAGQPGQFGSPVMMEWSDLRIFLAIARTGTLGAAARQLGQTQPTMGRRLRALEAAVGQTLFQRTRDGFVLTEERSEEHTSELQSLMRNSS